MNKKQLAFSEGISKGYNLGRGKMIPVSRYEMQGRMVGLKNSKHVGKCEQSLYKMIIITLIYKLIKGQGLWQKKELEQFFPP